MKKAYDFSKAKRGAVVATPPGKVRITIRIDEDVIDWFKAAADEAGGGNYQTMINQALRESVAEKKEPIEKTIRRVIRQELNRQGAA